MRTTIAIDDDVYYAVKERARRENRSAGSVLSELARDALLGRVGRNAPVGGRTEMFLGFEPLPNRGAAVSNALVDKLREEGPE